MGDAEIVIRLQDYAVPLELEDHGALRSYISVL